MEAVTRQLPRIRELQRLLKVTTRLIVREFAATHASVYLEVVEETSHLPGYQRVLSQGPQPLSLVPRLDADSVLIRWLKEQRHVLHTPTYQSDRGRDPYPRLHLILQNLQAQVVVPSFSGRRLLGFLVVGKRLTSPADYTPQDLEALTHVAQGCAIALKNARSYEELKATAQQLHAAQERLLRQERTVAAGRLAMGLAHEIKNPLAAIKTFTEFLTERYDDPAFRQEFVQVITKEVDRINGIVQSLADVTKQPVLQKIEPTDLRHLLKELIALLSNDCLKRGIAVQTTFEEPLLVPGDAGQLKQAFLNLCMNALDAMPKGGTLSVSCVYEGSEAVVRIADTGVGIPQEHLGLIFEPFWSTKDGGMGLGLASVKQAVAQHFGSVHVESKPARGSVFEIRLPWAQKWSGQPGAATPPRPRVAPAPPSLSRKIDLLVVDDEPKIRHQVLGYFAAQGCRTRGVATGEEALALLETDPPQLVLLDLKLEGIDGMETLTRLKERAPELPVIIVSGTIDDEAMERRLRALGACACVRKPVSLSHLQRAVAEAAASSVRPT